MRQNLGGVGQIVATFAFAPKFLQHRGDSRERLMHLNWSSVSGKRLPVLPLVSFYSSNLPCQRAFTTVRPRQKAQFPTRQHQQPNMTTTATTLKGQPLNKAALDALLRRRLLYTPSFEVCYGLLVHISLKTTGAC